MEKYMNELLDAIKYYMRLSIGSGIFLLLPVFLVSLAMGTIVTRLAFTKTL